MRRKARSSAADARGASSVSADIDQLLAPKSYEQLETLEVQVKRKLDSDEPIDYDYWEQLLRSLRVWKAKAKLRRVSQEIVTERLQALRRQQTEEAASVQGKIYDMVKPIDESTEGQSTTVEYDAALDPQPLLKLRVEDKSLPQIEEKAFLDNVVSLQDNINMLFSALIASGQRASQNPKTWLRPKSNQVGRPNAQRIQTQGIPGHHDERFKICARREGGLLQGDHGSV